MLENQRIRISKKMLKESLMGLLCDESIHKISVREICDGAQINRTTFYKYYGSQYDLLGDMENDILTQIDAYLTADENYTGDILTRIIEFIDDNIILCKILINNNVDPDFPEKLFTLPAIKQQITQYTEKFSGGDSGYIFDFVVSGGYSTVKRWINKENREPPEEIAALLNSTIMKLFGDSRI